MKTIKPPRLIYTAAAMMMLLLVLVLLGRNWMHSQRIAAAPLDYNLSVHSEDEWLKIGRDTAQSFGLIGMPQREVWALMTRGSYLTLTGGGGVSQDREVPVFIYQAFGAVPTFNMFGLDGAATDIGGMTLLFDGTTGMLTNWAAYPKDVIVRGAAGLDLSFIPADSGPDQGLLENPVPTLAQ